MIDSLIRNKAKLEFLLDYEDVGDIRRSLANFGYSYPILNSGTVEAGYDISSDGDNSAKVNLEIKY